MSKNRWERSMRIACAVAAGTLAAACGKAAPSEPLVPNGSFEKAEAAPSNSTPFRQWTATIYAGAPEVRIGRVAKAGERSCMLVGGQNSRIRVFSDEIPLEVGRYRFTAWVRGLDLAEKEEGAGLDFGVGGRHHFLDTGKTFGWRKLEHVFTNDEQGRRIRIGFGLTGPGLAWIDDVNLSPAAGVELVPAHPILGLEATPFASEQETTSAFAECPLCGFRNVVGKRSCVACGASLKNVSTTPAERVRDIVTFETDNPFVGGGQVIETEALGGQHSLQIGRQWAHWPCHLDWSEFDWFEFDVFVPGKSPVELKIAVEDARSTGFATRFNESLYFPPGRSTHAVPIDQMRTGNGYSRGRPLNAGAIRNIAYETSSLETESIIIDDLRLARVGVSKRFRPPEMRAFDFGPKNALTMPGFEAATTENLRPVQREGEAEELPRVYGSFDQETFDPLGRDYVCIEVGRFGVDLPAGRYVVELTEAVPPDEYEIHAGKSEGPRRLTAEKTELFEEGDAKAVEHERRTQATPMDDSGPEELWTKYQRVFLRRHVFEIPVSDGRLDFIFEGSGCSWAVAGILVYPKRLHRQTSLYRTRLSAFRKRLLETRYRLLDSEQAEKTARSERRDRLLTRRDIVVFSRPDSKEVSPEFLPKSSDITDAIRMEGLPGEHQAVTFSILTGLELGTLEISAGALVGPRKLPRGLVKIGYVTNRFRAVVPDDSVFRIESGSVIPIAQVPVIPGRARRVVLSVRIPENTQPGHYETEVLLRGELIEVEKKIVLRLDVRHGEMATLDLGIGPQLDVTSLSQAPVEEVEQRFVTQSMETLSARGFNGVAGVPAPRIESASGGRFNVVTRKTDLWLAARRHRGRLSWFLSEPVSLSVPRNPDDVRIGSLLDRTLERLKSEAQRKDWPRLLVWLEPRQIETRRFANLLSALEESGSSDNIGWAVMFSDSTGSNDTPVLEFDRKADVVLFRNALDYIALPEKSRPQRWGIVGGPSSRSFGAEVFYLSRLHGLICHFGASWRAFQPRRLIEPAALVAPWASVGPDGDLVLSFRFIAETQAGLDDLRYLKALEALVEETDSRAGRALIEKWMEIGETSLRNQAERSSWLEWPELRERTLEMIDKLARKR